MTREIRTEIEVPGTPEEVWEAIATGPGISAWFVPTEIDGDELRQHHGSGMDFTSQITAVEPPRRFVYEDEFEAPGAGSARRLAVEFLVEARSGGTCVVRVVQSGFGDGEAWEQAAAGFAEGWATALNDLRLYLTHFAGRPAASVAASAPLDVPREQAWEALLDALGMPEPVEGRRVQTSGSAPPYGGVVERVRDGILTLILDTPGGGIGLVAAGGPEAEPSAFVRARLFGADAAAIAEREQQAWEEWLSRLQPARRDPAGAPGHAEPRR
jgi:uncharacterized protein YndB with AHSA1/START domain